MAQKQVNEHLKRMVSRLWQSEDQRVRNRIKVIQNILPYFIIYTDYKPKFRKQQMVELNETNLQKHIHDKWQDFRMFHRNLPYPCKTLSFKDNKYIDSEFSVKDLQSEQGSYGIDARFTPSYGNGDTLLWTMGMLDMTNGIDIVGEYYASYH
ncbi:MAG: hypothetical protein KJI71_01450 [Patescibacteria group bacterium]|nr:hypothetical protein [Patescibacteria group bacterium]